MKLPLALLFAIAASCGRAPQNPAPGVRVVVLGIDGMDPGFVERHWDSLPNLRQLANEGSFRRLSSTMPPQSPVAWSTVSTGLPPAEHGVFDFVHRDPVTMAPFSAIAEIQPPSRVLRLGPYEIPLVSGGFRSIRKGRTFWQVLAERGVPVTLLRMPANFPPVDCEALTLAGMGVPDLKGTFGTFTFYTNDPQEIEREAPGGRVVTFQLDQGHAQLTLEGPSNSLRRGHPATTATLDLVVDAATRAARFELDGEVTLLKEGEWSEWLPVQFPMLGPLARAKGMVRLYAKELGETVRLYVSPVNLDPESPDLPISTPASFSGELAARVGRYYTQGIAEDTAALRQGVLTRQEFLAQSAMVAREHLKLFHDALSRFEQGLLFFHFFSIDQNSHMLWGEHEDELLPVYQLVDREVGEVRKRIGDASLLILSDHGFTRFDRAVHVNAWLREKGWLHLKDGGAFTDIDWSRTKAYALGLNGLYLNRKGREAHGIVTEAEAGPLAAELISGLRALRDPAGDRPIASTVEPGGAGGPDLLIGYLPGYRGSWQTALGSTPDEVFEDNADAWIGDHCVDSRYVPGVLFVNRKIGSAAPKLEDVTVTLLRQFRIDPPAGMKGLGF